MKKFALLVWAVVSSFYATAQTVDYALAMVKSHGKEWSANAGWDYVNGLVTNAILVYTQSHTVDRFTRQAYSWCKTFADNALYPDGTFIYFKPGSLDNIAAGKVLLGLYQSEEAQLPGSGARYKVAADYLYNYLRNQYTRITVPEAAGCFIHKDRYPNQMWLDGMYMGAAFYAQYLAMFAPDDNEGWCDVANQFITIHNYTYDEDKHLNYHAWSADPYDANSFWANRTNPHRGCSREFWGRGMGWYFAALADVIELMPTSHPDYKWMVEIYIEVAEGLKEWQDPASGVWYQLLQYDDTFTSRAGNRNYLEASASCMFAYGFLKGLRLGLLDEAVYREVAQKAYAGVLDTFITGDAAGTIDIHRICRSAGLGPASDLSRDGSADYYLDGHDVNIVSNEGKGIGSFIFASMEYERSVADGINSAVADPDPGTPLYNLQGIPVDIRDARPGLYITRGRKILIP